MTEQPYRRWRALHLGSSGVLALLALIHVALAIPLHDGWNPAAVWFAGTGLGLFILAGINLAYIGVEPCRQPTTKAIRIANYLMAAFGVAAVAAVPEAQACVVLAALLGQAVAGPRTLPGPV
jgi:hypothetical membrane protein